MSSSKDFHHGTKKSVRSFCEISSAETMGIIIHFWHLMEASIFQKSHLISDVLFFSSRKLQEATWLRKHHRTWRRHVLQFLLQKEFRAQRLWFRRITHGRWKELHSEFLFSTLRIFNFFLFSVLNVIGGDFTIQSNHYITTKCNFWNAFRTLSSYLTQIYCIFNCGIK